MTTFDRTMLAAVVDGGAMTGLNLRDVQLLQLGLRLVAQQLGRRDGAVPADVRVLEGLLDRAVASAMTTSRLPSVAVLGSLGSAAPAPLDMLQAMEISEVAAQIGCGQRNVRDLIARGALPAWKVAGRWLVAPLDLLELLDSRRYA